MDMSQSIIDRDALFDLWSRHPRSKQDLLRLFGNAKVLTGIQKGSDEISELSQGKIKRNSIHECFVQFSRPRQAGIFSCSFEQIP